jgi:hypothetical protein
MWKAKQQQKRFTQRFENMYEAPPTKLGRLARIAKNALMPEKKTSGRVVLRAQFKLGNARTSTTSIKQHVLDSEHAKLFNSLVNSKAYESLLTNKRNMARTKTGFTAVPGQKIKPFYEQGVLPRYPVFVKANIVVLTSSRLVVDYTVDLKRDTKKVEQNVKQVDNTFAPRKFTRSHRRESLRVLARVLKHTFLTSPKVVESMFGCVLEPSVLPWPAKYVLEKTTKPTKRALTLKSSKVEDLVWSGLNKIWVVVTTKHGADLDGILRTYQESMQKQHKCVVKSKLATNKVPKEVEHCYYLKNIKVLDSRAQSATTTQSVLQADLVAPVVGDFSGKQKQRIVNQALSKLSKAMHLAYDGLLEVKSVHSSANSAPSKHAWALCKFDFAKVDGLDEGKYKRLLDKDRNRLLAELTQMVQVELTNFKALACKFECQDGRVVASIRRPFESRMGLASESLWVLARTDFKEHVVQSTSKQAVKQAAKRIQKESNKYGLPYAKSDSTDALVISLEKIGFTVC